MKIIYCLVLVAVAVEAKPFLGSLITGFSSLGTDLGKKTADVLKNTVSVGTDALNSTAKIGLGTSKLALTGVGAVTKQALDNVGKVGNEAIDVVGIIGNKLGPLGKPINIIEGVAREVLDRGIDGTKSVVSTGENIGTKTMTVADVAVELTAGTTQNLANAGSQFTHGTLDAINGGIWDFFG